MEEQEKNEQMELDWTIPENWDDISDEKGSRTDIKGPHKCRIMSMKKYITDNGDKSYKVEVDVDDENDPLNGCFRKSYYSNGRQWPNAGTKYISLKEENLNYFKAFIKDLEESNAVDLGVKSGVVPDLSKFEGLEIGGIFILEEYKKNGQLRIGSALSEFVNLAALSEERTDVIRLLDGTFIDYDEYQKR